MRVERQLVAGGEAGRRRDAGDERVLAGLLGEVALRLVGQEELDEALGVVALVGGVDHARGGHQQQAAEVALGPKKWFSLTTSGSSTFAWSL